MSLLSLKYAVIAALAIAALSVMACTKEVVKTVEVPGETVVKEVPVEVVKEVVVTKEGETKVVEVEVVKEVVVTKEGKTQIVEVVKEVVVEKPVEVTVPVAANLPAASKPKGKLTVAVPLVPPLVQLQSLDARGTVGGFGIDWNIFEGIVRSQWAPPPTVPSQDTYVPEIASSWEIAGDQTSITFAVREGIPWHNTHGEFGDVTASDIVWTFNDSFKEGSTGNPGEQLPPGHKVGWEIVGDKARMNVKEAGFDPLWGMLHGGIGWGATYGITSKVAYETLGEDKFLTHAVGTGPYVVESWDGHDQMTANTSAGHWRITPRVETLQVIEMPEQGVREAAMRTGEVEVAQMPGKALPNLVADTGGKVITLGKPSPNTIYWSGNYWGETCPNCANTDVQANLESDWYGAHEAIEKGYAWVGDPNDSVSMENARLVRWALSMAIDRDKIVSTVLGGFGQTAYVATNITPDRPEFKPEWRVAYDVEKAQQNLIDAGYPDGFDITLWSACNLPAIWDCEIADAIGEMWIDNLGLNVTVDHADYAVRRPESVDKTMNTPWLHGIGWLPGQSLASFYCAHPGHLGGVTLPDDICEVGLRNDVESDMDQRIANNVTMTDYMSHWQTQSVIATVGNYFIYSPKIVEWRPYITGYFNSPETIVLSD